MFGRNFAADKKRSGRQVQWETSENKGNSPVPMQPQHRNGRQMEHKWETNGTQRDSFSTELFGESCGPRHLQRTTSTRQMEEHCDARRRQRARRHTQDGTRGTSERQVFQWETSRLGYKWDTNGRSAKSRPKAPKKTTETNAAKAPTVSRRQVEDK